MSTDAQLPLRADIASPCPSRGLVRAVTAQLRRHDGRYGRGRRIGCRQKRHHAGHPASVDGRAASTRRVHCPAAASGVVDSAQLPRGGRRGGHPAETRPPPEERKPWRPSAPSPRWGDRAVGRSCCTASLETRTKAPPQRGARHHLVAVRDGRSRAQSAHRRYSWQLRAARAAPDRHGALVQTRLLRRRATTAIDVHTQARCGAPEHLQARSNTDIIFIPDPRVIARWRAMPCRYLGQRHGGGP